MLEHKHMELVHSITINEAPILKMTRTVRVPARSIAVLNTKCKIDSTHLGQIYKTRLDHMVQNSHPNLITLSAVHCMDALVQTGIPLIVLNLGTYSIELLKDQVVRHLDNEEIDISEIHTEAGLSLDSDSGYESNDESDKESEPDSKEISSFIISPADIETHRKVELKDKEIDDEYKKQFEDLCEKYKDIFSADSTDIGKTPLLQMEIDTGNNPPICQKPYTLALKHAEWVKRELNILEEAGVIVHSVSPWASPIVIVPKRTAPGEPPKHRLCVDYRALNGLLPPVQKAHSKAKGILSLVPLPKIDEIYAHLQGSGVYTTLDMRSGYHHLVLSKKSRPKSAFVTPLGKWEFKRCPFGLAQALAYFQRLINEVLAPFDFAFGYLDDILIYSPDVKTHLKHLEMIFARLREVGLKLKREKCNFIKEHLQYLGHIISEKGITPVPEKLDSIENMPAPRTPKEVKQFLGLVGYYRKFIPRFADIARPLNALTRKAVDFVWDEICERSFQLLKQMIIQEPILVYPDPDKPYVLFTDASKYAWSCVLTQEYTHIIDGKEKKILHPITYMSGLF